MRTHANKHDRNANIYTPPPVKSLYTLMLMGGFSTFVHRYCVQMSSEVHGSGMRYSVLGLCSDPRKFLNRPFHVKFSAGFLMELCTLEPNPYAWYFLTQLHADLHPGVRKIPSYEF